jgi:hypothetical protein
MTPFTDVYPYAISTINDYRLTALMNQSNDTFLLKMKELLMIAIPRFTDCMQSLEYDYTTEKFTNTLTYYEKAILGEFMVIVWVETITNDITQINAHIQGRSNKTNSEATNLKEKSNYLDKLYERVQNHINDYQHTSDNFNTIFEIQQ